MKRNIAIALLVAVVVVQAAMLHTSTRAMTNAAETLKASRVALEECDRMGKELKDRLSACEFSRELWRQLYEWTQGRRDL